MGSSQITMEPSKTTVAPSKTTEVPTNATVRTTVASYIQTTPLSLYDGVATSSLVIH